MAYIAKIGSTTWPGAGSTISVWHHGGTSAVSGLTDLGGSALSNPFFISGALASAGSSYWGFNTPAMDQIDVYWNEGSSYLVQKAIVKSPDTPEEVGAAASTHEHSPVSYLPSNFTINYGTLVSGTLATVSAFDGNYLTIAESSGTSAMQVTMSFSGVSACNNLTWRGYYNGHSSHDIHVEVYNVTGAVWDYLESFSTTTGAEWHSMPIYNGAAYINDSNVVSARARHEGNGVTTDRLYVDYVVLQHGVGITAGGVSDHGSLNGLDQNDHPQYMLISNLDDTPVNGEVSAAITSNWAYDHAAASSSVHGIAAVSALATSATVSAAIETHRTDTTDVHGISNTSALAYTSAVNTSITSAVSAHNTSDTAHGFPSISGIANKVTLPSEFVFIYRSATQPSAAEITAFFNSLSGVFNTSNLSTDNILWWEVSGGAITMLADGGSYLFSGGDSTFEYIPLGLSAEGANFIWDGGPTEFNYLGTFNAEGITYNFSGGDATLTYTSAGGSTSFTEGFEALTTGLPGTGDSGWTIRESQYVISDACATGATSRTGSRAIGMIADGYGGNQVAGLQFENVTLNAGTLKAWTRKSGADATKPFDVYINNVSAGVLTPTVSGTTYTEVTCSGLPAITNGQLEIRLYVNLDEYASYWIDDMSWTDA